MKRLLITLLVALWIIPVSAQLSYIGERKYNGEDKNEVLGYLNFGYNSVSKTFVGPAFFYKRHFTSRWSAEGAVDVPIGKERYGVSARGIYCLPIKWFDIYFSGRFMYNRYQAYRTNEYVGNLSVSFDSRYFHFTVGESLISYSLLRSSYTEPFTFTFGLGANLRPRENKWNIGIYARNFDDFYYENWNINWGINWRAMLPTKVPMTLFGEFNLRPAGSTSQLATKYETSVKVGVKYQW